MTQTYHSWNLPQRNKSSHSQRDLSTDFPKGFICTNQNCKQHRCPTTGECIKNCGIVWQWDITQQ